MPSLVSLLSGQDQYDVGYLSEAEARLVVSRKQHHQIMTTMPGLNLAHFVKKVLLWHQKEIDVVLRALGIN